MASDSAIDNDATLYGDPVWQPIGGTLGGALQLDGVDDYLATPVELNPLEDSLTFCAWIKTSASGQVIASQLEGTYDWLTMDASGMLVTNLSFPLPALNSDVVVADDTWFVYLLLCGDDSYYCGITQDVAERVKAHQAGSGSKYVASRLPVKDVLAVSVPMTKSEALKLEYSTKQQTREEKVEYVRRWRRIDR